MALGDFTVTATSLTAVGDRYQVSGTAEVSHTATAFDILPNNTIINLVVEGGDDAGPVQQTLNQDADGNVDNGNVVLQASLNDVNTYNWTAQFR